MIHAMKLDTGLQAAPQTLAQARGEAAESARVSARLLGCRAALRRTLTPEGRRR
jgi:hypothetical protein